LQTGRELIIGDRQTGSKPTWCTLVRWPRNYA